MSLDALVEIKPTGKTTGEVVWEWHMWDHPIQDYDPAKANFGDVATHPELININFGTATAASVSRQPLPMKDLPIRRMAVKFVAHPPRRSRAAATGPAAAAPVRWRGIGRGGRGSADWTHVNAVDYNADFDQIMISVRNLSEVWIIDHSTTTAEAAGHTSGRNGKGGDILYRWGNPQAIAPALLRSTTLRPARCPLDSQGLPGAGHMLVFNNGRRGPGGNFSSVDEIVLPVDARPLLARARREVWARRARVELRCAKPIRLLFEFHLRRHASAQWQYGNLLRLQRHPVRSDGR